MHTEQHGEDFPSPIPWLERAGTVTPLDRVQSEFEARESEAPKLIQIRKSKSAGVGGAETRIVTSAAVKSSSAQPIFAASAPTTATNSGGPSAPNQTKKPKKKLPGSGIPARKVIQILVWVRRASQIGFIGLFLYYLASTAFRGTFTASAGEPVRLPHPVEAFGCDHDGERGREKRQAGEVAEAEIARKVVAHIGAEDARQA